MVTRAALHHSFKHYHREVISAIEFIQLFLNKKPLQPWDTSCVKRKSVRGTLGWQGDRKGMSSRRGRATSGLGATGSETVNSDPLPSSLSSVISPPWRFTISEDMYNPMPNPGNAFVVSSATR